ncbi:flagellar biosynthesis protein FlhF [Photobacterium sanctipauli]|uniref:Flagellar biosynthesis protein FlhF n=1 Tax=Photobacterium sanctipauli TaxID=1342794 RepID=A0A2T3NTF7_9GAMM|nr:flagellar biosynthesis protein FlhF [Photobacterium sanctipauli]PSW19529.1 flagellar biosynthesis protein FlhF [Photobacterium sanctipauli]
MKIKRFFAKDMRTALSQVKEELGADAVIMSNKKVTGGVEIVAAVDTDVANEPPAAPQARDALAERLGQAKRKLADDRVQLQKPAVSRFANVLQNYTGKDAGKGTGQHESSEQPETEVDSLSALLKRQSKHHGDNHQGYDREPARGSQREQQSSRNNNYGRDGLFGGQRDGGASRHEPRRDLRQEPSRSQMGRQPQHSLDVGDYRRPSVQKPEPLGQDRSHGGFGSRKPEPNRGGNRLDPSRYDAKASQYSNDEIDAMRNEMASIRRLLEHQVSGLMWQEVERREPMRAMMIKRLEKMGLSPELADQLACYIPEDVPSNEAWPALLDLLADQLITTEDCILETGGVVALLGPTGVGKTTTIAKLAARAAMDFGPDQIALVTTDTFRIGAHEQLATYGRIMGCPVRVAKDAEELADILHQLRHRRLVLLDTAGMGQRDIRLSEQLDTLMQNSGSQIRSFLVLPATAQRRVLHETIEHFRRIPLSGCVLTKLDESLSLGEVICVSIQHALPIAYLADGQRVPEDIKVATGNYLVARANELLEQELSQQSHFWSSDSSENQAADFYD